MAAGSGGARLGGTLLGVMAMLILPLIIWAMTDFLLSDAGYRGSALVQVGYLAGGVVATVALFTVAIRSLDSSDDRDQVGFRSGLRVAITIGTVFWSLLAAAGLIITLIIGACIALLGG